MGQIKPRLQAWLQPHHVVALDTCIWIYHFAENPDYLSLTTALLDEISHGKPAVGSEITLLEVLVRPLQLDQQDIADEYQALLTHFPNFKLLLPNRDILLQAAALRARYKLRTPDAIIIATAVLSGAGLIITNDLNWKRVEAIDVLCLDELCQ